MSTLQGHPLLSLSLSLSLSLARSLLIYKRGHTALHEACLEGHTHLSLLLISLRASLQARSKEGWTPLMCACSRGHLQLVEVVVAAGGEVNDLTRVSTALPFSLNSS